MSLNPDQTEALRKLERHVQDNVRMVMQLRGDEKPDADKITSFIEEGETLAANCQAAGVPESSNFEVTEYEDYTTLKFTLASIRSDFSKWNGGTKSTGKSSKKEKLTDDQKSAIESLVNRVEGKLQTILDIRAKQNPKESQVETLVEQVEIGLRECAEANVPDNYSFEATNYNDSTKVKFTINQLRTEIPIWKTAHKDVVKSRKSKQDQDEKDSAERKKKEDAYEALNEDQKDVIRTFNLNFDQMSEKIGNMNAGDHHALLDGPSYAEYLTEVFSNLKKSKLPDDYYLEDAKVTLKQVKEALPDWITLAKNGEELAELSDGYRSISSILREAESGNSSAKENSIEVVERLEESIKKANKKKLPGTIVIIGDQYQGIRDISFDELKNSFNSWKEVFAKGKSDKEARYKKAIESYTKLLSDDKLDLFRSEVKERMMVDPDGSVKWIHGGYYGEGAKFLSTPTDFSKSKVWASTAYTYTNTDVLKLHPSWYVDAYHFDGMRLANTTRKRGDGKFPPDSEFKFQPK